MRGKAFILFAAVAAAAAFAFPGCDSKPGDPSPDNPLDPGNPDTGGDPFGLSAAFDVDRVILTWIEPAVDGLSGYVIYRQHERQGAPVVLDTAAAGSSNYTDLSPAWAKVTYRIAALGPGGVMSDTSEGRGVDTLSVPPVFVIGDGTGTTTTRELSLEIRGLGITTVSIADDPAFTGAQPEPYDTFHSWTLPDTIATDTLYTRLVRDDGIPADTATLSGSIRPLRASGTLELAGGDTLTAVSSVPVVASGQALISVILSEDTIFTTGAPDSVVSFEEPAAWNGSFQWAFDDSLTTKRLYARFFTDFGADTTVLDTIVPDPLQDVTLVVAGGDSTVSECMVPVSLTARATHMDPAGTGFRDYETSFFWDFTETTNDARIFRVVLRNDFVDEISYKDTVEFVFRATQLFMDEVTDTLSVGDTLTVGGGIVAASCSEELGDIVEITVGVAPPETTDAAKSWELDLILPEGVVDEFPLDSLGADTLTAEAAAIARTISGGSTLAADTVLIRIAP